MDKTRLIEICREVSCDLPTKYSNDEINITELVKRHKEIIKEYNDIVRKELPNENEYAEDMTVLTFRIKQIAELIEIRKLEHNPQDALVIVDYLKNTVSQLEKFYKERTEVK